MGLSVEQFVKWKTAVNYTTMHHLHSKMSFDSAHDLLTWWHGSQIDWWWNNWYHQDSPMWKPKTVGVLWFPQLKPKQWIDHELTMQGNCGLNEFWKTWGVTCSSFLLHPFLAAATVSWWSWLLCLFPTVHGYCKSLDLILWVASYPSCCNSQLSELAEDFPTMKRLWFACLSAGASGPRSMPGSRMPGPRPIQWDLKIRWIKMLCAWDNFNQLLQLAVSIFAMFQKGFI